MSPADQLRLADYLAHIQEAIERCRRYVAGMDEAAFLRDEKTQDAVIRTFEVIGEATNNVKKRFPEFAEQHPEIPWGMAIGMRNLLASRWTWSWYGKPSTRTFRACCAMSPS
jgi:uncharacterized protein with HEPN domain